jgi:hypothetical protein
MNNTLTCNFAGTNFFRYEFKKIYIRIANR